VGETPPPLDEFPLELIGQLHGIAAGLFVPFVIQRLSRTPDDRTCDLEVELVGIGGVARAERRLRIAWQRESVLERPLGVQDHVVTEWAALGIAAAVVWQYAGVRINAVAEVGQSFDYWVSDRDGLVGLEVSGTVTDELDSRHRAKVRQCSPTTSPSAATLSWSVSPGIESSSRSMPLRRLSREDDPSSGHLL
jgi:hypothetical protein